MSVIAPVATSMTLVLSIAAGTRGTQVRIRGGNVCEAWEGDDPEVDGVNYTVTIELEGRT